MIGTRYSLIHERRALIKVFVDRVRVFCENLYRIAQVQN